MVATMAAGAGRACLSDGQLLFHVTCSRTIFRAEHSRGLGEHTKQGAFNPGHVHCGRGDHDPMMGLVADHGGMARWFIIPLLCFGRDCRLRPRLETLESRDSAGWR